MSIAIEGLRSSESQLKRADLQDHEIDLENRQVMVINDEKGHALMLRKINNTQLFAREINGDKEKILGRIRVEDEVKLHHQVGGETVWIQPLGLMPGRVRTFRVSVPSNYTVFNEGH